MSKILTRTQYKCILYKLCIKYTVQSKVPYCIQHQIKKPLHEVNSEGQKWDKINKISDINFVMISKLTNQKKGHKIFMKTLLVKKGIINTNIHFKTT